MPPHYKIGGDVSYPEHAAHARHSATSLAAAQAVERRGKETRERLVYRLLSEQPRTTHELSLATGLAREVLVPRCSEMKARGLLGPTGHKRPGAYGDEQEVLRVIAPYSQQRGEKTKSSKVLLLNECVKMLDEIMLVFGTERRDMIERATLHKSAELSAKIKRQ